MAKEAPHIGIVGNEITPHRSFNASDAGSGNDFQSSGLKYLNTSEEIHGRFDTLTNPQREALKLRYGLDNGITRSYAEIGEELSIHPSSARQRIQRALKKLRNPNRSRFVKDYLEPEEETAQFGAGGFPGKTPEGQPTTLFEMDTGHPLFKSREKGSIAERRIAQNPRIAKVLDGIEILLRDLNDPSSDVAKILSRVPREELDKFLNARSGDQKEGKQDITEE